MPATLVLAAWEPEIAPLRRLARAVAPERLVLGTVGVGAVEDQLAKHVRRGVDGRDGVQMQVAGGAGTGLGSFHVLHYSTIRQTAYCGIATSGDQLMRITC
jgi:hypothetical protein